MPTLHTHNTPPYSPLQLFSHSLSCLFGNIARVLFMAGTVELSAASPEIICTANRYLDPWF
jgi:hypothetical protein